MTTHMTLKRNCRASFVWCMLTTTLLLQATLGAAAQEFANEDTAASNPQTTFAFVRTADVSAIGSLAADAENDIWATSVLSSVALHFNGTQWKQVPMATGSRINKVAVLSPNDVWAVGQQTQANFSQIQHFDGIRWSVVPSPHFKLGETLNSVKILSANSAWAVGSFLDKRNNPTPLVEHFDGTTWSTVRVPHITGGALLDLAIISSSDIWAVGATPASVLTLHFDGARWSRMPSPGTGALIGVTALSSSDAWAVGVGIGTGAITEHWNGTAWKIVDNPSDTGSMLTSVSAISSSDIWAVGCTVTACGDAGGSPLVEHWDGNQWNLNSAPIKDDGESAISVLAFPSRRIYIGGFVFATSGPTSFILKGVEGH